MKAIVATIAVIVIIGIAWVALQSSNQTSVNMVSNKVNPTETMDYTSPIPSSTTTGTMMTTTNPTITGVSVKSMTVSLNEQNSSGQSGTATLTETSGKVIVKITLTGTPAGSDEPAHIHTGQCPEVGDVKYPLNNVKNGLSTTTLNTTMAQLQSQLPLGLNVHKSTAEIKSYVACGDLGI